MTINLDDLMKEGALQVAINYAVIPGGTIDTDQIGIDREHFRPDGNSERAPEKCPYKEGDEVYAFTPTQASNFKSEILKIAKVYKVTIINTGGEVEMPDFKAAFNPKVAALYHSVNIQQLFIVKKDDMDRVFKYSK